MARYSWVAGSGGTPCVSLKRNRRADTIPGSSTSSGTCVSSYHLLYSCSRSAVDGRDCTTITALGISSPPLLPANAGLADTSLPLPAPSAPGRSGNGEDGEGRDEAEHRPDPHDTHREPPQAPGRAA